MVASQWNPILVYSKGPWHRRERWPDVLRTTGKEKDWHRWQQPLDVVEKLVSYFSKPGDLIVDQCGGGFTTAEACRHLSRKCVSCDLDPECVGKGQDRINNARLSAQAPGSPLEGANPGVDDIRIASLLAGKEV
jgi:site-specific DNA-methyltransferase (adenine-specific)